MNKNFSRFSVFLFFYLTTSIHAAVAPIKWSGAMDDALMDAVSKNHGKNWNKIALETSNFLGFTVNRDQCFQRWNKSINPEVIYGRWSVEEDNLLRRMVSGTSLKKKWQYQL